MSEEKNIINEKTLNFPKAEMSLYTALLENVKGNCSPSFRPFLMGFSHEIASAMQTMDFRGPLPLPSQIPPQIKEEIHAAVQALLYQYKEQIVTNTIAPLVIRVLQAEGQKIN